MSIKKDIRKNFRDSVFKRDNYCCKWCGRGPYTFSAEEHLDAHHITNKNKMLKGGYVKENGITLCKKPAGLMFIDGEYGLPDIELELDSCHMKAEKFHITNGIEHEIGMHPNDLYKLIDSSLEKAIQESEKLK